MALSDNVTHYYKFDADNSNDAVGSNNGTDTSITYSAGNGKINHGAGFNGSTSKLLLAKDSGTAPTGNFSICGWFKTSSASAQEIYQAFSDGASSPGADTRGINVIVAAGGKVQFNAYATGASIGSATTANTYNDGNWHFFVVSWDGTTYKLKVDDTDGASFASATAPNYRTGAVCAIGIGSEVENGSSYANPFNGAQDEIGFWSRALSDAEKTFLAQGRQYPFISTFVKAAAATVSNAASRSSTVVRLLTLKRLAAVSVSNAVARLVTVVANWIEVKFIQGARQSSTFSADTRTSAAMFTQDSRSTSTFNQDSHP